MNLLKSIPHWALVPLILAAGGLFFRFAMRGYEYIAYTLFFFALLKVVLHFTFGGLHRAVLILFAVGLLYFLAVEVPIIKNSFSDKGSDRECVIVLGAAVHGDEPSLALQHRLEGALKYLEKNPDSIAVLSGGKGAGENISEARCMYEWLLAHGVDESRLFPEDRSASTAENLTNSFAILRGMGIEPDDNVALVSSSYHLYRAKTMASMLGVDAAGIAGTPGYPVYMLNCYIREAFGMTHLWVFGM